MSRFQHEVNGEEMKTEEERRGACTGCGREVRLNNRLMAPVVREP
jgi:hypothetical protein